MDIQSSNIKSFSPTIKGIWIVFIISFAIIAGTFSALFSYIALLMSVITLFVLSDEDALCFLMFIMPFANLFKASAQSQSFFTYLLLLYVVFYWFKKRSVNATFATCFFALVAFLLVQMIISINVLRTIKFIANILFIYIAINSKAWENNRRIYLFYITGIIASSLVAITGIIPNLTDYIGTKDLGYAYEELARFSGLYADPNYYSVNLIISLCLIVILNHKQQLRMLPSLCLATPLIVFVILTYSKSAFLGMLLPLVLLFYSKIKSRKYFIFAILTTFGIVFAFNLFAGEIEIFDTVLSRFSTDEGLSSLTTNRSDIWMEYIEFFKNATWELLFGCGFGAEVVGTHGAHNTYIDLLYYLGIVGTILLLIGVGTITRIHTPSFRKNILNYSVWICIFTMYFFLSELFYFDWPFHIVIAILVSQTQMKSIKEGGK